MSDKGDGGFQNLVRTILIGIGLIYLAFASQKMLQSYKFHKICIFFCSVQCFFLTFKHSKEFGKF